MEESAGTYRYHPTPEFAKKLERLRREDPPGYERVWEVIGRLLENPGDGDGILAGPRRGLLKKYAGRSGHRIIYNWCDACRKANRRLAEVCDFCGTIPDRSVVFHDLYRKNEAKRLHY